MEKIWDIKCVFYEINEILKKMPLNYIEKVPNKLKKFIDKNRINNSFVYNSEVTLDKQNMLYGTRVFLSILYRLYWCSDETKKGKF